MFIGIRTQAGIKESELAMQKNIFLNNKCNSSQEVKIMLNRFNNLIYLDKKDRILD